LNDPDLYSHTVHHFFDRHPLFSIFPDVQRTLNAYRQEQLDTVQKAIQNQKIDASQLAIMNKNGSQFIGDGLMEIEEDKNPFIEEEDDEMMQFDKKQSVPRASHKLLSS
jgi:hypothetical protein